LIRDEKEEVERREGMDGGEEDGEVGEGSRGGQTPKHSGNATPRPDTIEKDSNSPGSNLKPQPGVSGSLSRTASRVNSRAGSPAGSERRREAEGEDATMVDPTTKEVDDTAADTPMPEASEAPEAPIEAGTPQVTVEEPREDGAVEEGETEDKMDTT